MITDKRLFLRQGSKTKSCCGGSIRKRQTNNSSVRKATKNKVSASEYLQALRNNKT